ncbi:hypothetical protein [Bacillus gaemokensis]|uniref:Permease n=1 Tax=Bacillus gaemokensis TaxID=574375 RepID=A0A073K8Z2_9BACI|nr:hypothetical protein [Bacillus gaemokensis]KEK23020.1 hypothetical protein BAGA_14420 [Bacillus gaemokensis]KYG37749.1 hypothetical protein AZF08_22380 [Bacillus gaemokensis]
MLFYVVYGLQLANGFEGYWPSILFYTTYMTGVFIWIPIVSKIGIHRSLYWSVFITIVSIISVAFFKDSSLWLEGSALVSGFSVSTISSMTSTLLFRHVERGGKVFNENQQAMIIFIVFFLLIVILLAISLVNLPLVTLVYGSCLISILLAIRKMPTIEKVKEMPSFSIIGAVVRFLLFSLLVILLRASRSIDNEQIILFFLIVTILLVGFMLFKLLRGQFFHKLSSSLPAKLKAQSFLLGFGNGYLFLIGIFYSFAFYNILTSIFIVIGPYLLGMLMSTLLNNKTVKKMNPVYIFLLSTFLMLFGFYSPIFIILSVTIGSYTFNMISSKNNMNVYTHNPSHRELSLLIHTTWRSIGNMCLQFFVFVVIVTVGIYYDTQWSQLFQTIVGRNKLEIPGLPVPLLMFILAFCCWLGMVGLGVWISKRSTPKEA